MPVERLEIAEVGEEATVLNVLAAPIDENEPPEVLPLERPVGKIRRLWRALNSGIEWLFGFATLFVGLAVLAALPLFQFLSLGYLLESGARVARTGRLRSGFVGVRKAARIGTICLGTWLVLLPVRFLSDMALSAEIIDPGGPVAGKWRLGLLVLVALAMLHIASAWSRGGRLRDFAWPFSFLWFVRRLWRGGFYREARDAVWQRLIGLRLPYYFSLGVRGFAGALAWLALPITLLACGRGHSPVATLLGFLGGFLLAFVLLYLPFLQMRLAQQNRLRAVFELGSVRAGFKRAPWAYAVSLFITLLFAVPLYLLKIEVVPREAAWLPSLVFIAFIFPARLLTGWALARSDRRETPRHWFFRWTARLPLLPIVLAYVVIVFFTQFTSWNGVWSLYEQHAFLVPVPFFGM